MARISVTIPDEIYQKMENRAKKKDAQNLSQCAKELIELGLLVEAAAEKNTDGVVEESGVLDEIKSIKTLLEYTMRWALEGRTYGRYLIEHIESKPREKNIEMANIIKEKAKQNIINKAYLHEEKP